jgi:hypothetical protein
MNSIVYTWLSELFNTDVDKLKSGLKNELASSFLIVWSIFEQSCFKGFIRVNDIRNFSDKYKAIINIEVLNEAFEHFHNRYQDNRKYINLKHRDRYYDADEICRKNIMDLTDEDKLLFLIYVIYRFRNNIFHGNKGVMSWTRYTTQITYCVNSMIRIIDELNKNNYIVNI